MMTTAFAASTPLSAARPSTAAFTPAVTPAPPARTATITMRSRRDLKKEKSLRNLEFARSHRKRTIKRYNRRAVQEAIHNEDNEYLASIYGTLRFGSDKDKDREQ